MKEEKKERKEEKLMKELPLCKLSLSKYYSCSNYSIRYIHLPSRKFEFQEPEFLGKNFFPILPLSKIDSVAEISIYLIYYLYIRFQPLITSR